MSSQQAKYELLKEQDGLRQKHTYIQVCLLLGLCAISSIAVYTTWTVIYRRNLNYPPKLVETSNNWTNRATIYAEYFTHYNDKFDHSTTTIITTPNNRTSSYPKFPLLIKQIDNERIHPSKYGNYIYSRTKNLNAENGKKLVCYYAAPNSLNKPKELYPNSIDPHLCTHLNVGLINIVNNSLHLDNTLISLFQQTVTLKKQNKNLKILLWAGGIDASGFQEMIKNHANRKLFIQSLKVTLETYRLDGIDLDWEFPSAFNRERQHFSQLLHEIRREYQREHRTYLLTVAVAAPKTIIDTAYDVEEINNYADFINVMTYDYHMYTKWTPFTGLNAPLYKRHDEFAILATLNINYTAYYWHSQGIEKDKIVIGLPTYGHSFKLVNAFNTGLHSPAESYGNVGSLGFTSYSEVCWFRQNNIYVTTVFDTETCSPYLYAANEWISYEDERSLECKANWIKSNGFGGAMIFSLNTDDYGSYCLQNNKNNNDNKINDEDADDNDDNKFPLVKKIYSILFDKLFKSTTKLINATTIIEP